MKKQSAWTGLWETLQPPTDPMRPPSAVDTPGSLDQGWVAELGVPPPVDLALLEVDLPDGDGYRLAHQLRATDDLAVVFLSAEDRVEEILAGFDAGADDYILKTRPRRELLARVAAVLRRTHAIAQVWRVGDLVIDEHSAVATRGGSVAALTETEFRLLVVFVRHEGITLSKRQLLNVVWGDDSYGCNVVERHVGSVLHR